jgi:four helix bundle protein
MRDFRQLRVWQKARELVLSIYRVTRAFPKDELFGKISQMRRSGTSIAANIAEGCGRHGAAELARFLQIALGSASELESYVILASDLKYLRSADQLALVKSISEVKKILASFVRNLRADG